LPAPDRSFDFVLTFTVLQHLTDRVVPLALAEAVRLVKPSGFILLCEDTDPASRHGDVADESGMCVIGRPVGAYAAMLPSCCLLSTAPRRVEPTYPVRDVGTYMLFSAPPDARTASGPDRSWAPGGGGTR
jgi:SAM-dependent methyltransferase